MKERFVCMLLAMAVAASMCVAASAQSTDTALLEKISAQELAITNQELPWKIQLLETLEEDTALQEQLHESDQTVCEYIWYDEAGNRIDDPELIAKLWSAMVSRGPVYQTCCDNPSYTIYYSENHVYGVPLPAKCLYSLTEVVCCTNCRTTISHTIVAKYYHTHY